MKAIGGVDPSAALAGVRPIEGGAKANGPDLGEAFTKALSEARGLEKESASSAERFAQGDPGVGIHEVVIAAEKANISLRYMTTLKNKAIEAYRELMNTQV